jgi:ribosomal protein S18 acetylase RimI-like enzyme
VDENDCVLGSYYIKPNQPKLGAHICNVGYVVDEPQRGRGIASMMCEHSQADAIRQGFLAMQFNFVVSTNVGALRLWEKHGFSIIGTVPQAFQHAGGYVDAFIMHKQLHSI